MTKTAVDLYSGIGGWTLGLQMAGIETVASYEWWSTANATHRLNFPNATHEVDIRALDAASIPEVEFIVGSPPCTQFSYSNRGGSGDLVDGLRDVAKFLEVVDHHRPRAWAMENVPRVAKILRAEIAKGGSLRRFANLIKVIEVVDVAEFGVPQSRSRMIAGDFSIDLLRAYRERTVRRSLGDVIDALDADPVIDPVYGYFLPQGDLTGNEREEPLDDEELRMNREAKRFHPVYNLMSFPDRPDRPARTVTATCTRVSRESIVIRDVDAYRRLTIRERASLQTFPITFDFEAKSHSECLKMTGNAIPPLMTYYIAHAMLGTDPASVPAPSEVEYRQAKPDFSPPAPLPDKPTRKYPATRRFRAAIPNLRFGSGVRFELANEFDGDPKWRVGFYFGTSKAISRKTLNQDLWDELTATGPIADWLDRPEAFAEVERLATGLSAGALQARWVHQAGGVHPFQLVDALGTAALELIATAPPELTEIASDWAAENLLAGRQEAKLRRQSLAILAGMAVGSRFNTRFDIPTPAEHRVALEVVA